MVLAHNFIHQEEKLFFPFQQKHGLCFFCCILANNTCYIYNTCLCWYNRVFWVGTYTKLDTTNFHLNIISHFFLYLLWSSGNAIYYAYYCLFSMRIIRALYQRTGRTLVILQFQEIIKQNHMKSRNILK